MAGLTATVDHGPDPDIITIAVRGDLDFATAATVRAVLLKALVDCPVAIIVDLTHCQVMTTAALAVFPAIAPRRELGASTVIAVAGLSADDDSRTPAALGGISTYPDTYAAYAAIRPGTGSERGGGHSVQPTPTPPRHASPVVEPARLEWSLGAQLLRYSNGVPAEGTLLVVRATRYTDGLKVSVAGEIDINVADQLTYVLVVELPPEREVTIDFAEVTFCDSSGIAAMIELRNHLAATGRTMRLINTSENVRRPFELSGLVAFLGMHN